MKQGLSLLLICTLFCTTALAQGNKKELPADEVKAIAEAAFKNGERVSITLKERTVVRSFDEGCNYPRKFSANVTYVNEAVFRLEDKSFVFGAIDSSVTFDNVASIKRENKTAHQLKRAAQSTGFVALVAAASPVFLGGFVVCAASNGKLALWACPR